mgnify:CR=1
KPSPMANQNKGVNNSLGMAILTRLLVVWRCVLENQVIWISAIWQVDYPRYVF